MWWDVYFADYDPEDGNKIPVRGRVCRYNYNTNQVELLTGYASLPNNFRLRGIAIGWGKDGNGGLWVVGANDSNGGRLEAYRVCENTWITDSYHNCVDLQNIRLLCNRGALEVGVKPLKTYVGLYGQKSVKMKAQIQIQFPLLGEWDKLNMTAVFPSSGGFIESRIYTENDIPPSHAPALEAVV